MGRLRPAVRTVEALPAVYLTHWRAKGITQLDVDQAEYWVRNMSKWEVAGAWRARVVNGTLWVRMLSMQPHWAERTSVLRLLHMAVKRGAARGEPLGDLDIVYAHNDRDPTPLRGWPPGNHSARRKIPLLTNGHEQGRSSLPVPEFSWVGWHTHTPPWCQLYGEVAAAGRLPWANRSDIAYFSGGLSNGPVRQQFRKLSQTAQAEGVIKVRNVAPRFFTTTAAARAGKDPPQPMSALCGYKYLISLAGYGYSNRLKSLLMCGSVVIHVQQPWNEFFMPMLADGRQLVIARRVSDIIDIVHRLRANSSHAERVGRAGRHLAANQMSFERALDYFHGLLRSYGAIQRRHATNGRLELSTSGFTPIRTAADLGRLAGQCDCGAGESRTSAERCGVDKEEFATTRRSFQGGRYRCCEGYDCALDVCTAAQQQRVMRGRRHNAERLRVTSDTGSRSVTVRETEPQRRTGIPV